MTTGEAKQTLSELCRAWRGERVATIADRVIYCGNVGGVLDGHRFLFSVKCKEVEGKFCPVCYNQPWHTEEATERSFYLPSVITLFGWRDMEHFRKVTHTQAGRSWATAKTILRAFEHWKKGQYRYKRRNYRTVGTRQN